MTPLRRIAVGDLPEPPLAAAAAFHHHWLPQAEQALAEGADVMVTLGRADHSHRAWRHAVAAGLARAHAPRRVNLVAGEAAALDAFASYLARAPGITGQYFESDSLAAGDTPA